MALEKSKAFTFTTVTLFSLLLRGSVFWKMNVHIKGGIEEPST